MSEPMLWTEPSRCLLQETWWAFLLLPVVQPFYVPGVAPRNFHQGDVVDIKVILKSFCMTVRVHMCC